MSLQSYVLWFSSKPVVKKPIGYCTWGCCATIKLHGFVDKQHCTLTRDKTFKKVLQQISSASGSIRIFLMKTSNVSCQKDLGIDSSSYILHRYEFTTSFIGKEIWQYCFQPNFLRKSVLHLLCEWFWPSVFLCIHCLCCPKKTSKQNSFEPSSLL